MPKETVICYLSSLLFYGMGYSKMAVLNSDHLNTYDFTVDVTFATVYFVLTIFLAVIGSYIFYFKAFTKVIRINEIEFKVKADRGSVDRRRASLLAVKDQFSQTEYCMDLKRKMSS